MAKLDELLPRENARVMACAEDTHVGADLDSVADYHEACVQDCKAVVVNIHSAIHMYVYVSKGTGDKLPVEKAILPNNHITPVIRQKRRFHKCPIASLPNDPAQHFQSLGEYLVVGDCFRVERVIVGCQAAAVVACFEKLGVIGIVPVASISLFCEFGNEEMGGNTSCRRSCIHIARTWERHSGPAQGQ